MGKKVIINSVIYSISGLLLRCCSFFLLPLYTAYLTTEDYGVTSLVTSFITTMGFVVAFSLFSAVMRFYVELKEDKENLKKFYGTICSFVFTSSICFFIILTVFKDVLSKHVFAGINFYPIILICLISLVFYCQYMIFDNILRSQQRAFKSSVFSIVFFFITLIFNILFVVHMKMGAVGSLLATLIGYFFYTIYFVVELTVKREIIWGIDFGLLKAALKYSIPIMPHNLSTQIAVLVSKVLIGDAASLSSVGIYSVATQFGSIADTIQGYVDNAYAPWLYEKLHVREDGYNRNIRDVVKLLISVLGLFFIGIALFAQDYIILFINKDYADAWRYVPLIVEVFAIKTVYYFYVEVLFFYKDASKKLFLATLTSSVVNILLSYYLIPYFGIYGSIVADFISMVIRVSIIYIISKQYGNIGLYLMDFIKNFAVVSLFIFGGLMLSYVRFPYEFSVLNFLYKIVVVFIYVGIVLFVYRKQLMPVLLSAKMKLKRTRKNDHE